MLARVIQQSADPHQLAPEYVTHAKHNFSAAADISNTKAGSRIKGSGDQISNIAKKAIPAARITTMILDTLGVSPHPG
jgi:hypothetical protein